MQILASAKVNLTLGVMKRDDDGYHDLVSTVCFTAFGDKLSLTDAPQQQTGHITDHIAGHITGPYADALANAGGDTLLRAAYQLAQSIRPDIARYHSEIEKNIPLGGGLGGGSADAAALLRYISADWSQTDKAALRTASLTLGADVPACFDNHMQIMSGRGENALPLTPPPSRPYMVIANPHCHADTAAIFTDFATSAQPFHPTSKSALIEAITRYLDQNDFASLIDLGNDLTKTATSLYPPIATLLDDMTMLGKSFGGDFITHAMSGSGASCFALLQSQDSADTYKKALEERGFWHNQRFFLEAKQSVVRKTYQNS